MNDWTDLIKSHAPAVMNMIVANMEKQNAAQDAAHAIVSELAKANVQLADMNLTLCQYILEEAKK